MYGSIKAFIGQFGEREASALACRTVPESDGEEIDEELIGRALEAASSEADSYLAVRYRVPVNPEPHMLHIVVNDIARYRLTGADRLETDPVVRRYEEAIRWLTNASRGVVDITGQDGDGDGEPDDGAGVMIEPGRREWLL